MKLFLWMCVIVPLVFGASSVFALDAESLVCESVMDECLFATESVLMDDAIYLDRDLDGINHRLGAALLPMPDPISQIKPVIASYVAKRAPVLPPEALTSLFAEAEETYGVPAEKLSTIAKCESGFRAEAVGGGGAYGGMFQFMASTWASNRNAMGANPDANLRFDAREAIMTAAFKMSRDGFGAWPMCGAR